MRISPCRWRPILAGALLMFASRILPAQKPAGDTLRTGADSVTPHALEGVTVTAIRARSDAPISRKTLALAEIEERYHGQDIPLLLQGTPSLTIKSETGTPWGYSYIRLRGMEQRRINFTLDGIPLNDPEDHVLYFADFPDLGNSLQSVQIQRGVGTSSAGVAAYAGSVNLEAVSLATAPRQADIQLQLGSFGSRRASAEWSSGLLANNTAFYTRASALSTNGYRRHAGIGAYSGFFSGGYFGSRDVVKLTATAGVFADTMAYVGATREQIAQDRRFNPLRPDERDRFGEQLVALTHVRSLGDASSLSTTVYRITASGDFDVCIDRCDESVADLWKFDLDFTWYGLTTAWNVQRPGVSVSLGTNANRYARDHHAYARPDVRNPLYFNTGYKGDLSAFAKTAYDVGRVTIFGDLQVRHARFRYEPDEYAGIEGAAINWTFVNPKVGITYRADRQLSLYASYGVNSREPAREDMFGGFDNLDSTNVAFVGSLDRVKPERAADLELGLIVERGRLSVQANLFDMRFRNEILPIGELSYIGTPLRKNVPSSSRRGVELDAAFRAHADVVVSGNATVMTSRIREYTDRNGTTYRAVPALLTPRVQATQRVSWTPARTLSLNVEGRYIGRSQLTNTDDPALVLPSSYVLDARGSWTFRRYSLTVAGANLNNSRAFSTGNVSSSGTPRYFVLAPPNVQAIVQVTF